MQILSATKLRCSQRTLCDVSLYEDN